MTLAYTPALQPLFTFLPGFKTYAKDPVWSDSTRGEVAFHRMTKKAAWAAYRKLKAWNASQPVERKQVTRTDGKVFNRPVRYSGALGDACLRVFECLVFDFLNFRNGRLDPSYEGIAKKTGLGRSTVAGALKTLKALRVINWVRRCSTHHDEQRGVRFEQETNAYAVLPPSSWLGYVEPPSAPPPHPEAWGAAPVMLSPVDQARIDAPGDTEALIRALELEDRDPLKAVLSRLGRSVLARGKA